MTAFVSIVEKAAAGILVAGLLVLSGCSDPSGQQELKAGVRELDRGNYVRARSLLEKSIARRPGHIDNAPAHNYLGIAAWRLGQYAEAMTAFEDCRRLNPHLIEPVYNLGVLAAERDDLRTARSYLKEAADMNPEDPLALEYLAELYMAREEWTQARNLLYTALDRDPRSARIYNTIATAHVGLKQPDQALESLMLALEADTRYAPALYNLAVVYDTMVGDADQARAYYRRYLSSITKNGKSEEVREALTRLDEKGTLRSTQEEAPKAKMPAGASPASPAVDPAAKPVAKTPPSVTTYDTLMQQASDRAKSGEVQPAIDLYVRAATAAASDRRIDLEEKAYREAVRNAIDQPRAHALLGQHFYNRGRYEQAERSFRQAATLSEEYAPAQLGLARLAARNNEADAAVVHYRQAMTSDPSSPEAFWEYAQLYDKQFNLAENAARAYREFARAFPSDARRTAALARAEELAPAPKANPENVAARESALDYRPPATPNTRAALQAFNQARTLQDKKDWKSAIFFYLRALENDDTIPSIFYNLGISYTMNGERSSAREAYVSVLRLQPDNQDARYNLALLLMDGGEKEQAARLLEEVVKARPGYASAHSALGLIYSGSPQTLNLARQHYQRFIELAPQDPSVGEIRAWLRKP